jgi:hypothetical protein
MSVLRTATNLKTVYTAYYNNRKAFYIQMYFGMYNNWTHFQNLPDGVAEVMQERCAVRDR